MSYNAQSAIIRTHRTYQPKKAMPFNKRDQRDEKDEREVADNARLCRALGSDNADARPRSGPYRLSCPSRPKITRDKKDERDDSEVADNARQCGAHDSDNADTRPRSRPYRLSCLSCPKITLIHPLMTLWQSHRKLQAANLAVLYIYCATMKEYGIFNNRET